MSSHPLTLTDEERDYLVARLECELQEARVEFHHTKTGTYRDVVKTEEALLRRLLAKLGQPVAQAGES